MHHVIISSRALQHLLTSLPFYFASFVPFASSLVLSLSRAHLHMHIRIRAPPPLIKTLQGQSVRHAYFTRDHPVARTHGKYLDGSKNLIPKPSSNLPQRSLTNETLPCASPPHPVKLPIPPKGKYRPSNHIHPHPEKERNLTAPPTPPTTHPAAQHPPDPTPPVPKPTKRASAVAAEERDRRAGRRT